MYDPVKTVIDTNDLIITPATSYSNIAILGVDLDADATTEQKVPKLYEVGSTYELSQIPKLLNESPAPTYPVFTEKSQIYQSALTAFKNGASKLWLVYAKETAGSSETDFAAKSRGYNNCADIISALNIQFVVLAGETENIIPVEAGDPINETYVSTLLKNIVSEGITNRLGFFMWKSGENASTCPTAVRGATALADNSLVGFAHKADNIVVGEGSDAVTLKGDAAAAMAGLASSIKPSSSIAYKALNGITFGGDFTRSEIDAMLAIQMNPITTSFHRGNDWFTPRFFTCGTGTRTLADTERVIAYVEEVFEKRLCQQDIVGTLRINAKDMGILADIVAGLLASIAADGIIEDDYAYNIPVMQALRKPASSRTPYEQELVAAAVGNRTVTIQVTVRFYGCVYEIEINPLKFTY